MSQRTIVVDVEKDEDSGVEWVGYKISGDAIRYDAFPLGSYTVGEVLNIPELPANVYFGAELNALFREMRLVGRFEYAEKERLDGGCPQQIIGYSPSSGTHKILARYLVKITDTLLVVGRLELQRGWVRFRLNAADDIQPESLLELGFLLSEYRWKKIRIEEKDKRRQQHHRMEIGVGFATQKRKEQGGQTREKIRIAAEIVLKNDRALLDNMTDFATAVRKQLSEQRQHAENCDPEATRGESHRNVRRVLSNIYKEERLKRPELNFSMHEAKLFHR